MVKISNTTTKLLLLATWAFVGTSYVTNPGRAPPVLGSRPGPPLPPLPHMSDRYGPGPLPIGELEGKGSSRDYHGERKSSRESKKDERKRRREARRRERQDRKRTSSNGGKYSASDNRGAYSGSVPPPPEPKVKNFSLSVPFFSMSVGGDDKDTDNSTSGKKSGGRKVKVNAPFVNVETEMYENSDPVSGAKPKPRSVKVSAPFVNVDTKSDDDSNGKSNGKSGKSVKVGAPFVGIDVARN